VCNTASVKLWGERIGENKSPWQPSNPRDRNNEHSKKKDEATSTRSSLASAGSDWPVIEANRKPLRLCRKLKVDEMTHLIFSRDRSEGLMKQRVNGTRRKRKKRE